MGSPLGRLGQAQGLDRRLGYVPSLLPSAGTLLSVGVPGGVGAVLGLALEVSMVYRLTVAYRGTAYSGWQRQPNAVTVQDLQDMANKYLDPSIYALGIAGPES